MYIVHVLLDTELMKDALFREKLEVVLSEWQQRDMTRFIGLASDWDTPLAELVVIYIRAYQSILMEILGLIRRVIGY